MCEVSDISDFFMIPTGVLFQMMGTKELVLTGGISSQTCCEFALSLSCALNQIVSSVILSIHLFRESFQLPVHVYAYVYAYIYKIYIYIFMYMYIICICICICIARMNMCTYS